MARLNEPPAPVESNLDILRRKFLRQNRDLARVNSNQSNRIRVLENDCARLLSENLELRGQVMRLEKELENNTANRIADHALEIKAKMEAQLAELGTMLATLGTEPPAKRHSPDRRKLARPAPTRGLKSPTQRKQRDQTVDQDSLSAQEGRLPPIYENKTYPRATMNSEQILALCAEAADTSTSPDIGPPPVSRFVDEEIVKDTPVKSMEKPRNEVEDTHMGMEDAAPPSKINFQRKSPKNTEYVAETASVTLKVKPDTDAGRAKSSAPNAAALAVKAGAKRKFGDENDVRGGKGPAGVENSTNGPRIAEKPTPGDILKSRTIKEIPASKKKLGSRPPLSAKSTNDDVSSPSKIMREEVGKPARSQKKPLSLDDVLQRQKDQKPAPILKLEIPSQAKPTPPVETILSDPCEPATPGLALAPPDTPDQTAPREPARDTPPPGHLSVDGETTRPSRRARPAISYAEPNLRDKMRRPTKELFDAVAGEGKFKTRMSISAPATAQKGDASAPTSITKPNSAARSASTSTSEDTAANSEARLSHLTSPLAQRDQQPTSMDILPSSVVTGRKRRPSSISSNGQDSFIPPSTEPENETSSPAPARQNTAHSSFSSAMPDRPLVSLDIYNFNSSPASSGGKSPQQAAEDLARSKRQPRRASAAAHQAMREIAAMDADGDGDSKTHGKGKPRKRASMQVPKRPAMELLEPGYEEESSLGSREEGDGGKVGRRRSMML